jgi:hypothetical protein
VAFELPPIDALSESALMAESPADPATLLAAVFWNTDARLLKKLAEAFPDVAPLQWLRVCRSSGDIERRSTIAALRKSDSTNALGAYLSAAERMKSGHFEIALQELVEADGCPNFSCYEGSLRGALRIVLEKRGVSFSGVIEQFESLLESASRQQKLDDFGLRLIPQLASHFREGGDEQAAFVARDMAANLGRRMQSSSISVLSRMGLEVERETFSSFGVDPESGIQSQRHREKLESALAEIMAAEESHRAWRQSATESEWAAFGKLLVQRGQVGALREMHKISLERRRAAPSGRRG